MKATVQPSLFLVASSLPSVTALEACIAELSPVDESIVCERCFASDDVVTPTGLVDAFRGIANVITAYLEKSNQPLGYSLHIVVDRVDASRMDPVGEPEWSRLVGMLVLAFPEANWTFVHVDNAPAEWPEGKSGWDAIGEHRLNPLFDGSGLRNLVRQLAKRGSFPSNDLDHVPTRTKLCAALDEETSYAWFHAYSAYRWGRRAFALTRFSDAEVLFGRGRSVTPQVTTLEDIYLGYPDTPIKVRLSRLDKITEADRLSTGCRGYRGDLLPGLEKVDRRIFITTGHSEKTNPPDWVANAPYMKSADPAVGFPWWVAKPARGLFQLADCTNLRPAPADFVWPYTKPKRATGHISHSAPPRLKEVTDVLLRRAGQISQKANSMEALVAAATLSRDALELLGPRTATLAIEALASVHELEVRAECEFAGVQYHFEVTSRLKSVKDEILAMSLWIAEENREAFSWSAEAMILTRLNRVFRNYGQFEEEQECLVRLRDLNRNLRIAQYRAHPRWLFRQLQWLKYPMVYFDFLLCSVGHLIGVTLGVVGVLALLFWLTAPLGKDGLLNSFWLAFQTFVAIQPPGNTGNISGISAVFVGLAMVLGFMHLGVLISHIYSLISRK